MCFEKGAQHWGFRCCFSSLPSLCFSVNILKDTSLSLCRVRSLSVQRQCSVVDYSARLVLVYICHGHENNLHSRGNETKVKVIKLYIHVFQFSASIKISKFSPCKRRDQDKDIDISLVKIQSEIAQISGKKMWNQACCSQGANDHFTFITIPDECRS